MNNAPSLVAMLALAGALYANGAVRLGRRLRRTVAFYGGLVILAAALMSPLDRLASRWFSAHMVQHLLLMLVAAPLLAYSRPAAAFVAGLPPEGRALVRRARAEILRAVAHALGHPLLVWTVGVLALWAWHMPALYGLAMSNDAVHVIEHACFLAVSLLFWSVVFDSGRRRGVARPVALALVFATGVQSAALGAILAFASTPLYAAHAVGAPASGMSPLEDQQLAGSLMWGPPALLYVVTMAWLLVRWFAEMEEASTDTLGSTAGQAR